MPGGVLFLREVAAPLFLGRPDHHCVYCLVSKAPLGLAAIGLFLAGVFCTAWACLARWLASDEESRGFLPRTVASCLSWASLAWLGAAAVTAFRFLV